MTLPEGRPGLVPKSSPVSGNVCLPKGIDTGTCVPHVPLCSVSQRTQFEASSILTWKNKKSKHFLIG